MSEIHALVLWSSAMAAEERILADLSTRFELLDANRLEWSRSRFDDNLRRLYGWDVTARNKKAAETGTDPFLLLVVRDPAPAYAPRRRSGGMTPVNINVYDAKHRYRRWTSAAFAIHASNDAAEARRDIFLLLARPASDYAAGTAIPWTSRPRSLRAEVTGAEGWRSLRELLTALDVAGGYAALPRGPDVDEAAGDLEVLVADGSRVHHLLGRPGASQATVSVAGRPWTVRVHVLGDGDLDARWQLAILREAVTAPSGARVAGSDHRAYVALYRAVAHTGEPLAPLRIHLDAEARGALPPGDFTDPALVQALVEAFLRTNRWTFSVPTDPATARNRAVLGARARLRRVVRARAPRIADAGAAVERRLRPRAR